MMPTTHYEHSGKAPLGGILLALIGGAAASLILGGIYGFLIFWSPFVYINFFITLIFGFGVAMAVGGLAKLGKIRNNGIASLLGLVCAVLGYFVHWAVWVSLIVDSQVYDPVSVWAWIQTVAEQGAWSIFGWTPAGFWLWAIWGIEAAMIIGIGSLGAHGLIDTPFCETTGRWTKENVLGARFKLIPEGSMIDSPSAMLQVLEPESDSSTAFAEITTHTADGSELRCVTINQVTLTFDKDGKEEAEKTEVVRNMIFDRGSFDRLMQLAGASPA